MKFKISDAFRFGWNVFKQDYVFLITLLLIIFAVNILLFLMQSGVSSDPLILALLFIHIAIIVVVYIGIVKISLNYTYNIESHYNDLFNHAHYAFKFFIANVLYLLLVVAGLILLIIPGIYWAMKYSQINYFIIDKDMDPIEAFKASGKVTYNAKMDLFLFYLSFLGLTILSVVTFFLGLIILIPVLYIAQAFIYRELVRNTKTTDDEQYITET